MQRFSAAELPIVPVACSDGSVHWSETCARGQDLLDSVDWSGKIPITTAPSAECENLASGENVMVLLAPAKINLTLAVLGKRPDGFHEIESLVAAVTLFDELAFSGRADSELELTCDDQGCLPLDSRNLVRRAAEVLARRLDLSRGLTIHLSKRIPIGAGLGGGSSDAAATLLGLNLWWDLGLSRSQLAGIGAEIGSDVPFFFYPPVAVVTGRGERVRPVAIDLPSWITLVLPEISVSTAAVFARLGGASSQELRVGASARRNRAGDEVSQPDEAAPPESVERVLAAARQPGRRLARALTNDLEPAAFQVEPALASLHPKLESLADRPVRLSGSGSALFTLFDSQQEANDFGERVRTCLSVPTCVVRMLGFQLSQADGRLGGSLSSTN